MNLVLQLKTFLNEKTYYFCNQNSDIMKTISDYNFEGKRALIRVDFNVPLRGDDFHITDDTRIRGALLTIQHILKNGGSVVLMSHLGRPKSGYEEKFSLKHIVPHLSELVGTEVQFASSCIGEEAEKITSSLKPGQVVLLENLRFFEQETAGDKIFAGNLAKHGDVYVNDAFGTAHRAHASTTIIAQFFPHDKMFGLLLENEITNVDLVLNSDKKPVTAVVGGAKVSSKITIIERLIEKVDYLIIGGGMAYTFIKAQGGQIGSSLVEDDYLEVALSILEKAKANNTEICLPTDTKIADNFSNDANRKVSPIDEIPQGWMGLDIGEQTAEYFCGIINKSATILWNGPMGVFEMDNFQEGTISVANAIVEATKNGAFSLIGGGDSVAAINKYNLADQVSYVSTGGGAMLEYLEGKELPGIAAIRS
jgi:phosphoglycerate kinase